MGRNHTEMVKDWSEKIRTLEDDKIRLERECYRLLCFINEGNFRTCERFSGSGPQSLPYQSNVDDKHQHLFSMWANNIYKRYMSIKLTWYISNKNNFHSYSTHFWHYYIWENQKIHLRFMTSDKKPNEEWDWLKGTKIFFCPKWSWTDF